MMTAGTEENEEFAIHGEGGDYIKIVFAEVHGFPNETCHWGGYDSFQLVKLADGWKIAHVIDTRRKEKCR